MFVVFGVTAADGAKGCIAELAVGKGHDEAACALDGAKDAGIAFLVSVVDLAVGLGAKEVGVGAVACGDLGEDFVAGADGLGFECFEGGAWGHLGA